MTVLASPAEGDPSSAVTLMEVKVAPSGMVTELGKGAKSTPEMAVPWTE